MRRSAAQTRLHILNAAYGLFWRQGFLRVSMDEIAARAGITKRALYQHFRSKDALMADTLAYSSELALKRLRQFQRPVTTGDELIDSYFTQLGDWAAKPKYSGGGFTRAVVELADLRGHPARAIAANTSRLWKDGSRTNWPSRGLSPLATVPERSCC